jgi:flagellar biosynthetic protein FlhB
MSDASRSHKPSPKRIKEFRKRGEIALSKDLTAAITLGLGIAGVLLGGHAAWQAFCGMTKVAMSGAKIDDVAAAARAGFVAAVAPTLIAALLGCVLGGGVQLGWPPAFKKPSFDVSRWFGFAGVAELVSPAAMARRTLTAVAKVVLVGAVVALVVKSELGGLAAVTDPHTIPAKLSGAVIRLAMVSAAMLAGLAAVDFYLARRRLSTKMMMTPDELKREHKESEGDPHVKGKRRRRMRELAKRRLVAETKKADVVLVNPTHYAVALKYDAGKDGAPRVVAKGTDEVAARIREAARSAGVPIISRPPLARALHKLVPEGTEIPGQLFTAVAEVLAYVYRIKHGRRAG